MPFVQKVSLACLSDDCASGSRTIIRKQSGLCNRLHSAKAAKGSPCPPALNPLFSSICSRKCAQIFVMLSNDATLVARFSLGRPSAVAIIWAASCGETASVMRFRCCRMRSWLLLQVSLREVDQAIQAPVLQGALVLDCGQVT